MRAQQTLPSAAWCFSFLLGQASTLMGIMLSLGWMFAFAVVLPRASVWTTAPRVLLPIGPPLIGLALGAAALTIACLGRAPVARYAVAGLVFNAVPLVLALVLLML